MPRALRLLHIEDSDADAELLLRELALSGFEVLEHRVETPEEMALALEQHEFDLVISDYRLPRFTATEALELLHRLGKKDIPFLVVSGTIGELEAVHLLRAGARDFFLKDQMSRLGSAIERELAEAESRRNQRLAEEARQQAQDALARSEAFLRQVVESSPHGILTVDRAGIVHLANRQIETMFCYSRRELIGRSIDELRLLPSSRLGNPRTREGFLERPEASNASASREARGRRRDGSEFPVEVGLSVLDSKQGPLILAMVVDITEWRALQTQLQQAQKMEAIGRLAGGLAHDFNNVLSVIMAAADIGKDELAPDHPVQELLGEIEAAAGRAAGLTHQMLAFSRQQVMRPRPLNLNNAIKDSLKMLSQMIGEDVELRTRLAPDLGPVLADPTQFGQVLMNLAVNARDAMPQGGKLTFETAEVEIDEDYVQRHAAGLTGPYVMLLVSDSGTGMDEETRSRVFEPFFTTKEEGKGTGLGLSTVYGIVKQSGGFIWLYSEPGLGATFRIYLPRIVDLSDDSSTTMVRPSVLQTVPAGTGTILLVEDQEAVRRMTRKLLRRQGYEVLDAAESTEALRIAEELPGPIHLLLTDVVMPGMNGRELAASVVAVRPQIRVLFMSGYSNGIMEERGLLDESVQMIEKPFSANALARAVRQALETT